jgi:signal transduction histidine kinase
MLSRVDHRLTRAVGRIPVRVQTKLLAAFVIIVALLVVLVLLSLRVLGESNARIENLGLLQQRATKYQELNTDANQVQLMLTLRAGEGSIAWSGGVAPTAEELYAIDLTTSVSTVSRFGTDIGQLGFTQAPPADEQKILDQVGQDYQKFAQVMDQITADDRARTAAGKAKGLDLQRTQAEPLAEDMWTLTSGLAATTKGLTATTIVENSTSFADSQRLFIGVAAVSIVLALLLGYVISRSLIGPIRGMETRLAAIASGDFSGHVEVANRDELGTLAANINAMSDELGRLYREVESASRNKSDFLASMSHELRTPLNAIIGFSQVLRQQMFGALNEKQIEYIDDVLSSGQHLLNLINDILDLAKVEAGRMELQPGVFALDDTLRNAMAMVRERATRQDVTLRVEIDHSIGEIEADERKVKQILFNLLSNAVKFTPGGGSVTLSASTEANDAVITVRDTGMGISEEDQAKIFEEFTQLGPGMAQEGTGLGLALTKRLVDLHGGHLSLESAPEAGATFTVRLPLRRSEDRPAAPLISAQGAASA